jgi:seryl-tRNA synthetase
MAKKELLALLQSASVKDLKELLVLKKELDALEKKEKALLKQFTSVSKDIGSIQTAFGKPSRRKKPAARVKKTTRKGTRKSAKKKAVQPHLSSLIVEILKEKKKPLGVNDICDALLKEKKYKTKAKNFKANVRILLYKNEKGLFKKAGPGRFRPAAAKKK